MRKKRRKSNLPAGFAAALRKRIRGGQKAAAAMKATWKAFKRKKTR